MKHHGINKPLSTPKHSLKKGHKILIIAEIKDRPRTHLMQQEISSTIQSPRSKDQKKKERNPGLFHFHRTAPRTPHHRSVRRFQNASLSPSPQRLKKSAKTATPNTPNYITLGNEEQ